MRWDTDDGNRSAGLKISMDLKFAIVYNFRHLQRCRVASDWPTAMATFLKQVETAVMSQTHFKPLSNELKASQFEFIKAYFEKNWFKDVWIGMSSLIVSNNLVSNLTTKRDSRTSASLMELPEMER